MSGNEPVRIIGAGVAGLAAAVKLAGHGVPVEVSEGAAQAGGRCRSYHDPQLDMVIDNGNHLVLSGNTAVYDYLARIGADHALAGPDKAEFHWTNLRTGERWLLTPDEGPIPFWVFDPKRRPPGTRLADFLPLAKLIRPPRGRRVDQVVPASEPAWERLLEPFLLAMLNTAPAEGSADLAAAVVRETLAKGGRRYRPRIAEPTLSAAFIEPALTYLAAKGAALRTGRRLRAMEFAPNRVSTLTFPDRTEAVGEGAPVILAVPPQQAQTLVPGLSAPNEHRAIVNAHFKMTPPAGLPAMIGVIGGVVEWIFVFKDRISITISGADRLLDEPREALAQRLWGEVAQVHGLPAELPPWQIVRERRATFAATPAQDAKRPPSQTRWSNLILAGDWTQTGLPSTIEGAIRSGFKAADLALQVRRV
ncbi:hydroxysqualene dehydroxylase HpnE [soil metagenome]